MKLGILVNTDRHMEELTSITRAALSKGHEVSVFVMDAGVRLLATKELGELARLEGVSMAFCNYNAMTEDIDLSGIQPGAESGGQLDNATMVRDSDRVIAL